MNIIQNTHDKLVIEDRPIFIGGLVWFLSAAAVLAVLRGSTDALGETVLVTFLGVGGCVLAWHFFPFQRFTFDRKSGVLARRIARITGAKIKETQIADIKQAANQGSWSDGDRLERVALLMHNADPYPLEFGYSSTPRKPIIDAINAWLEDGQN